EHLVMVGFVPTVATHKFGFQVGDSSQIEVLLLYFLVFFATFTWGLRTAILTVFSVTILTLIVSGVGALFSITKPLLPLVSILPILVAWVAVVVMATHIAWITKLTQIGLGMLVVAAYGIGALTATGFVIGWNNSSGLIISSIWHITEMLLSMYMGWRIVTGDEKFALLRTIAIFLASVGGTNFKGSNLINADFTGAILKNTNFSKTRLKCTNFHLAKNIDTARVDNTILSNPVVQHLAVTKKASNKCKYYDGCDLTGINLDHADMSYADLTKTNISEATFKGANLEGANLTKTQAIKTNFQQANVTAACLEAWNIDSTTQLEGVICDYVYLLNNQQERRPSSGKFAPREFTKLFQIAINTVDLIFRNGLDLESLSVALAKVKRENEDIPLTIKSIENKGDGIVIVRVDVPELTHKEKIHAEVTRNYEFALQQLEARYQAELKSKETEISLYRQHQADLKELIQMIAPSTKKSTPGKLVILKLGQGNLSTGFPVTLQISLEGDRPYFESHGQLPPASNLIFLYNQWQSAYRQSLQGSLRIKFPETQVTNISQRELFKECNKLAENLKAHINLWLNSELFRPIKEQLLEKLNPSESIRILLQTEDSQLRRIPLQVWDFFERYPHAEMALSLTTYERKEKSISSKYHVKILAILGDSTGINIQQDRVLLEQLPNVEIKFLVEPKRPVLNDELWMQPWDILFFAGHSFTQTEQEIGHFHINSSDSLTIAELKNALTKAIERGLHLAIFNSCDGLGLATNLADLHIPQMIVMREPVPDKVAQEFLKNFLTEFSSAKPLYQSVREARLKLQGFEDKFPCASWLPVICQNPAEIPLTWNF
ncbi:pentapeptide repeat-containing protein, partial [Nostoc sp. CHAB 5715]|uniref:pentapeptide repeat-containing protein n=1 Tax=Nostoc sp. CHAB 5715 TaxID=2780400 RepID=UPI001E39246B